jgi:hypothetical protein
MQTLRVSCGIPEYDDEQYRKFAITECTGDYRLA